MKALWQQLKQHIFPLALAGGAIMGAGAFFVCPHLAVWGGSLLVASGGVLLLLLRRHRWLAGLLLGAGAYSLLMAWQTFALAAQQPVLSLPEERPLWLTGRIIDSKTGTQRTRLTLDHVTLYGPETAQPRQVRLSVHNTRLQALGLNIGDGIAAQVILQAPRSPAFPGDYDGRFQAFFTQLDASGYVRGGLYQTTLPNAPKRLLLPLHHFRHWLADHVTTQASPLAAALLTGLRDGVREEIKEAFRKSGLAHLLAISGLHLGLVGGLVFFVLRYLMALWPRLALTWPTKKVAAIGGLSASLGYMLLAGATIPTVRAFIMIALLFLAVWLERPRTGLRLWAVAVLAVLALWPYSVVTPSFQMSFAAALALILWAQSQPHDTGLLSSRRIGYIRGVWLSSLVAGLATLPLAAFHFQMVSFVGFVLNLLAIPLMGFWVLPAGLLALLLLPLGLDAPAFWAMQQGLNVLEWLATQGSQSFLGGWTVPRSAWPLLGAISLMGLLGIILHRARWALAAIALAMGSMMLWPHTPPADVVLLDYGQTVLICSPPNQCHIALASDRHKTADHYINWLRLEKTTQTPACDALACLYQLGEADILVSNNPATAEDCRLADLVLSPLPGACPTPGQGVETTYIWLDGAAPRMQAFVPSNKHVWE
jgi:competence protein ComEC